VSRSIVNRILPRFLRNILWGDRERWGLTVDPEDHHWLEWQETYAKFYLANQRKGVGKMINDAGYSVIADIDLSGKTVLEIGAGDIRHLSYWNGRPAKYLLADISLDMMKFAVGRLEAEGVPHESLILQREEGLPLADCSVDVIVSFYSLEHLYPLMPYVDQMLRVLKPGGVLIGAIPAEGGLAWGTGRAITSRRWFKKNTTIDPDKIICWEHPNFSDEILRALDARMDRESVNFWPFSWLPFPDVNLIIRYKYHRA